MGQENVKKELDLIIAAYKAAKLVMADGKVDIADLGALMLLVPVIGPAIDAIPKLKEDLKDLDAASASADVAYLLGGLALDDGKGKLVIEKSINVLVAAYDLYQVVK
ncbi:MAG: hypothetical protein IPQ08_06255 [Chitinophagaceae bacterium]|nr:hypothetical protein [Chitinophagaceae bacterium]